MCCKRFGGQKIPFYYIACGGRAFFPRKAAQAMHSLGRRIWPGLLFFKDLTVVAHNSSMGQCLNQWTTVGASGAILCHFCWLLV